MAARDGMANLIMRLRGMTQAGTADWTITATSTENYWSDDHLQDRLEMYATHINRAPLRQEPEYTGGTALYHDYYAPVGNLEEATSGTVYWAVEDGDGDNAGTANYSVDYITGLVRFTADQSGTAYYLRARSYNLNQAAAQVWREKAAYYATWYDFDTDNHSFKRSQVVKQCQDMVTFYERQSGGRSVKMVRSDLT